MSAILLVARAEARRRRAALLGLALLLALVGTAWREAHRPPVERLRVE